jgi:hypothetical protein
VLYADDRFRNTITTNIAIRSRLMMFSHFVVTVASGFGQSPPLSTDELTEERDGRPKYHQHEYRASEPKNFISVE